MKEPLDYSDTYPEWFEIYNDGGSAVDLTDYTITDDGGQSHTIGSLTIGAGDVVTLGRYADPGYNDQIAHDYRFISNARKAALGIRLVGESEEYDFRWTGAQTAQRRTRGQLLSANTLLLLVGVTGFEPATPPTPEADTLPGGAYLEGEYGHKGIYMGVPLVLVESLTVVSRHTLKGWKRDEILIHWSVTGAQPGKSIKIGLL